MIVELFNILGKSHYVRHDEEEVILYVQHTNEKLSKTELREIKNHTCRVSSTSKIDAMRFLTVIAPVIDYKKLKV